MKAHSTVVPWRTQMLSPVQANVAAIKIKCPLPLFRTHTSQHRNTVLEDSNDVVNIGVYFFHIHAKDYWKHSLKEASKRKTGLKRIWNIQNNTPFKFRTIPQPQLLRRTVNETPILNHLIVGWRKPPTMQETFHTFHICNQESFNIKNL